MIAVLNVMATNASTPDHNCCQDSFFVKETDGFIWGGVFDGCSKGVKSHWASQTFAYAFSGLYDDILTDNSLMQVYYELTGIKKRLGLDIVHFESTCLLFEFDKKLKKLSVRMFGDGFYSVNQVEYDIDQNNIPDYFGHYLGDQLKFMEYIDKYPIATYDDVENFKICSDGINSISIPQFVQQDGTDPLATLFANPTSKNFLERMWNKLRMKKFTTSDDLTIISYVQDEIGKAN